MDLLLIYPYFNDDNSIFKFPPLGIGYIASSAKSHGYSVEIIDCTFMKEEDALAMARSLKPRVIGIYSMLSMKNPAIRLARQLREHCDLMVAGGPLPTTNPNTFLNDFDVAVIGEGEQTVPEILTFLDRSDMSNVNGIAYREEGKGPVVVTPPRGFNINLDSLPFPSRELYDHNAYKKYFRKHHGYTITSMITSRGCPFSCDFCSRPVFGSSYRGKSPANVADEMESIARYGYDRLWIADDIFPISKKTGVAVCTEIIERGLDVSWECLCRADIMDHEIAAKMKKAGCRRVFFGLESGNNMVLKIMKKQITVEQARRAVETVNSVEIKAGAFFILGYPGESNDTMRDTIKLASSLPLDYLSFSVPYPLPGTGLYKKLKDRMVVDEWKKPRHDPVKHVLLYRSEFSTGKLKFGIIKAMTQHYLRKYLGSACSLIGKPIEVASDYIFTVMR